MRSWWLAGMLGLTGACSSAAPPPPEAPSPTPGGGTTAPALAWVVNEPATLTYGTTDTVNLSMAAGGADVQVNLTATADASMELAPATDGARATIRITALDGRATNTMGPTFTVGSGDLPGPAEVTVSRRGVVDIVQEPQLSANLRRILGPSDLYRRMFIRLPGRDIARGVEWTDTITVSEENNGLTSTTTTVLTSAWTHDTVVAGRALYVISSRARNQAHVAGATDGVQIEQNLTGQGTAVTLWDPQRRVIVERHESGTATGTTDLPAMGVSGMSTSLRASHRMRLKR